MVCQFELRCHNPLRFLTGNPLARIVTLLNPICFHVLECARNCCVVTAPLKDKTFFWRWTSKYLLKTMHGNGKTTFFWLKYAILICFFSLVMLIFGGANVQFAYHPRKVLPNKFPDLGPFFLCCIFPGDAFFLTHCISKVLRKFPNKIDFPSIKQTNKQPALTKTIVICCILGMVLPSWKGNLISHCKDPYTPANKMECHKGFERCAGDSNCDLFDPLIGGHHPLRRVIFLTIPKRSERGTGFSEILHYSRVISHHDPLIIPS